MPRPLNILTLATLFPNASAPNFGIFVERQTAELASRAEADVTVVNPVGLPPWPISQLAQYSALAGLPEHEEWNGLNVHRPNFTLVPKVGGSRNPKAIAAAVLPLLKHLHGKQPFDLIDAEFFYPDGPAAMRLSQALDIPFTIKARGADIHHWGVDPKCRAQILEAANQASALLAVSQALKQDMINLGMDGDKIALHYTGLDQQKFKPVDRAAAKAKLDVAGPLFICAGALIKRKNQALAIEALTAFPGATLLIAGKGEEEASYRALAAKLDVAERVRFLGSVPHDELPALVAASDIAVLVSKSEGLANAWVEALSCGTPIIISEAGGARELVRSDIAGRIVAQDVGAIIGAIRSVLAAPPSQGDVRATVSHFSWQNNGDQLLEIFRKVTTAF
ncbi:glycosyltransferase [Parasphingorhabdus halotolerans]|uniref:Glycosyltransferase family 4 protein n=1 Tax=Parasphingorhabdus halotolerans TaxID=2725558 RepID=A0A6H2DRE0_9SPHN|nr:glycosyltransferase [Parasphingorhabdus halotolerans]QJB70515.1 glycosyltransferase family 4 protein [Parasphingorhabdus halotolerans]